MSSNTYHATNGNLLSTAINPSGFNIVTSFGYNAIGKVTSLTDPRLNVTENLYDLNGRKIWTLSHNGGIAAALIAASKTNYDVLGRVTSEEGCTAFSGTTVTTCQTLKTMTYTKTGKVNTEANGANNTTTYTYDAMDRAVQVADPLNRLTRTEYDLAGQTLKEVRAYGTAIQQNYATYTYTLNGQRQTVKDANNNLSTFEYDGFDRLLKLRFPMPTKGANASSTTDYEQYGYDNNGNRASLRKRDAQVITYTYDALNRETLKDVPGTADDVYSGYDLAGRPIWKRFVSTSGQGIDYGYDTAKRIASETSFGRALTFLYDNNSNRTRITYPDTTNYISYEYDALNRMTYVRENGATSGAGVLAYYQYDALSRRGPLTRGNGTVTGYGYDAASRLTSLSQDLSGTTYDATLGFGYTLASQLQTRTTTNSALGWWAAPEKVHSYVVNGLNEYTSVSGTTYTHDLNGNLTSDGSRGFAYDVENRLITVSGTASMTLSYDPNGRLKQTISGSATTQYLYEGDRLTAEYNGAGPLLRRYVHGGGTDEPIVWYEGADLTDRRWLHSDERGSVIAHTDNAGVASPYRYGPYGEQPNWVGSRFSYTGQIMLPEVQLYHYKARVYDPGIGRFLQTDPIGYEDDFNLYAYVGNDPLDKTDPTGEDCVDPSTGPCETVTVTAPRFQPPIVAGTAAAVLTSEVAATGTGSGSLLAFATVGVGVVGAIYPSSTASDDTCDAGCNTMLDKAPKDAKDPNGAKAPGKPGAAEGFEDPKAGEEWVKGSDGRGGWKDAKGRVWQPTGPGSRAHGGSHWDRQNGDGTHTNVYPGGRTR